MIPIRLQLKNYGPFRGEHKLELQPLIYSITARDASDPERSNWIGKSWLMSAFRFALYGAHPAQTEDKWITDGEQDGIVELVLDNGVEITRSRKLGKSTQLCVKRGASEAVQDRAQEIIDKLVGFSRDDFDGSCWVRQKRANAIVVAEPAQRTRTIGGWMDLGPLQDAEKAESARLLAAVKEDSDQSRESERLRGLIDSVGDPRDLSASIAALEASIEANEIQLASLHSQIEQANNQDKLDRMITEFDKIVEDGKALKEAMKSEQAGGGDLQEKLSDADIAVRNADAAHRDAKAEADRISKLVVGAGFDGTCPVLRAACLAVDTVRSKAREMTEELAKARTKESEASKQRTAADKEFSQLQLLMRTRQINAGRLSSMRERATLLMESIEQAKKTVGNELLDGAALKAEAARMQAKIGIDSGMIAAVQRQLASVDGWIAELASIESERQQLQSKLRTHREALIVLGRNGAQREIAAGYLSDIEAGANELLVGAGIDLSVRVRWGREGGGLASHCQACGQPFPTSQKVKECAVCGAARGPKIIEKLELELSCASDGAAEDIAGLAMQLSAASWLRARRQAAWSSVFIDEPFAAADSRIGMLLASRLRALLGGRYSFRQAFVISHNAALTESMPGRIEIVRGADALSIGTR